MEYVLRLLESKKAYWTNELFKMQEYNESHFVKELSDECRAGMGYSAADFKIVKEKIESLERAKEIIEEFLINGN